MKCLILKVLRPSADLTERTPAVVILFLKFNTRFMFANSERRVSETQRSVRKETAATEHGIVFYALIKYHKFKSNNTH